MVDMMEVLKALSHENRLRILNLLSKRKLCVCELENIMKVNQSNASRHLNKLRQAELIKSEQEAQWVFYTLNEALINKHSFLQELISNELSALEVCRQDNNRLNNYENSDLSCENLSCGQFDLDEL